MRTTIQNDSSVRNTSVTAADARREYMRRYRAEHKEKFREYQQRYWAKRAEQMMVVKDGKTDTSK